MDKLMCLAQQALKMQNQPVQAGNSYERQASDGEVYMLILALDYKQTDNALTCSMDGRNMEKLARACGVTNVTAMYDEQCTKENVLEAISQVGEQVGEDDYFILYYSGHGTNLEDEDGDEEDGQDEAFCFVSPDGQISYETCMTDDDLAEALSENVDEGARILILTDCCHSGTIADLDKDCWADREVISIAGCTDSQTSGDMGRGGIFTHSMLLAVDQLSGASQEEYSVGMLYNATLKNDEEVFSSAQDITIQSSASVSPDRMAWPLIPQGDYKAPMSEATQAAGGPENVGGMDPQMLQTLGINPAQMTFVQSSNLLSGEIDPQKLLTAGVKLYMSGGCKDCAVM